MILHQVLTRILLQYSSLVNMRQRVKYNDHYPLRTPRVDSVVFIMAGKIIDWENMVEFLKIRQFILVT